MTLGIIARADQSGLAQLSEQVIARLQPERVLVVSLGNLNRGVHDAHRYDAPGRLVFHQTHPNGWSDAVLSGFLGGLTHVFTAETFYTPMLPVLAQSYGVRRHLYAMPELYMPGRPELDADQVWLPCGLGPHDGRRLRAQVLPWWCPTDSVLPMWDLSIETVRFVHPTGQAMADRNGTKEVLAAAAHVDTACVVNIVGNQQHFGDEARVGKVTVRRIPRVEDWRHVLVYGDVLVLPRRYGWLSLPMFEAAADGMPIITTDLWPQHEWFAEWPKLLVPTVGGPTAVRMKGGTILVHTAHPAHLGAAMEYLAAYPDEVVRYGAEVRTWAEGHDWESVKAQWLAVFD